MGSEETSGGGRDGQDNCNGSSWFERGGRPRILIIDDDPSVRGIFRKILSGDSDSGSAPNKLRALESVLFGADDQLSPERARFDVDLASSGEAGRDCAVRACADAKPYSVAFVDMRLPSGWDGLRTIEELWRIDEHIEVVICTAYADYSWDAIVRRLGQSDRLLILRKPFEQIEVLQLACALSNKWLLHRQRDEYQRLLEQRLETRTDELTQRQRFDQQLLEHLAEGVIACDTEGNFTLFNRVARQWHGVAGLRPERDIYHDWYQVDGVSPLTGEQNPLLRGLSGDTSSDTEFIILAEGRSRRRVSASGGPILDAGGDRRGAIVILHDVTEAYRNERRFTGLFEHATDAILMTDERGLITLANRQAEIMFGWKKSELQGQTVERLLPDVSAGHGNGASAYAKGMVAGEHRVGLHAIRRNGDTFPVEISCTTIDVGESITIAVFVRDVAERLFSEQAMRESSAMLSAIDDCAFIFDPGSLCFIYANEGAVRMLGYTRNEFRAMTPIDICSSLNEAEFRRSVQPLLNHETGSLHITTLFQRRDGTHINVDIHLQCVLMTGGDFRFIALARDVTERERVLQQLRRTTERLHRANLAVERERERLAERVTARTAELSKANRELEVAKRDAERANSAKSAFLATMSHEIRTPMNGVIGMLEILARSNLNEQQNDALKTARDSALSLLSIIDDVLDFSKIEAGQLELERIEVPVPELVEGVIGALLPLANDKQVELSLYIDPDVPERQWADPTRLRQILVNLVGNAIKFSSGRDDTRGRVQVDVEPSGSRRMQITVSDNGIGVSEDSQRKLFRSFSQAEESTTRRFGGTGLGLAICKRLVDAMHGDIGVDSRPGEGSRFHVVLPVDALTGNAGAQESLHGLDILVIDGPDADVAITYLSRAGASVERLGSRQAAVRRAEDMASAVIVHCVGQQSIDANQLQRDFGHLPDSHHLVITRDRRARFGSDSGGVAFYQALPLRRRPLLQAVATLGGQVSQTVESETGAFVQRKRSSNATAEAKLGRVLIAEDDFINQKVILKQLELLGYSTDLAENGREALARWRKHRYGLILTDLHMPEMDGYELAETIRTEEQEGPRVPIVALTASAVRGEEERVMRAGMDAYLTKPVQLDLLERALRTLLGHTDKNGGKPG